MTTQDLNNQKEEILSIISETCPQFEVEKVFEMMLKGVDCCDSIDELLEGSIIILGYDAPQRKVSKLAEMVCKHELEEGVKYNMMTKDFEKI